MKTLRETWHLDTANLGQRILVFDRLDSTSTYAAGLAGDHANHGLAIIADEQSAGRGQHGRTWLSPPGSNLLLSLLLFPPPLLRRAAVLTAWAAVAVCETIREVAGLQAQIKWPNDVLIQGRKVCGMLIEQKRATVVGVGLNINQTAESFLTAGLTEATSLAASAGREFQRRAVTEELLRQLDEAYGRLLQGDFGNLEARWLARLGLLGKEVIVECAKTQEVGRLKNVRLTGVELEQPEGLVTLAPERVQHLRLVERLPCPGTEELSPIP